jgi:TolA-binding protein
MKTIAYLLLISLSISCIKTAEEVQREKRLSSMSEQMKDSQGLLSDMVLQIKDIQGQMNRLNGRVEESEHRNKDVNTDSIKKMNESMALIKSQQDNLQTQLNAIQNEMKEQRSFIEKVTASLSSHNTSSNAGSKVQKKNAKNELQEALDLIKKNDYAQAKHDLEGLINHPELTPGEQNKVLFGLGKAEYFLRNHEKALAYFSRIYTKFPKASLAAPSLLFIGRCLQKMNKKDEGKQAFQNLIKDYPDSKEAKEAKKEL